MATIELQHSTSSFTDEGRGPAVVLIHGSASSRHQWRRLIARLAGRYRVLAPDLHGYGETVWHEPGPLRLANELGLVSTLAEHIGEPFHLVGDSCGGALALGAAVQLQSQIASLTLIEPAAFQLLRRGDLDAWHEIDDILQRHIELAWERRFEACADLFMHYSIGARAWAAMAPEKRAMVVAVMPKVAIEWLWISQVESGAEVFEQLDLPTLLVRGTRTKFAARRVVDMLMAALRRANLVEIEGAGHMAPVTHADLVNAAIEAHLDRHTARFPDAVPAMVAA